LTLLIVIKALDNNVYSLFGTTIKSSEPVTVHCVYI